MQRGGGASRNSCPVSTVGIRTIVDPNGKPIPGARVWLRNWNLPSNRQEDGGVIEVLTDRQGRFRHSGVEPGGHYPDVYVVGENESAFSGFNNDTFEPAPGKTVKRKITVNR